MRNSSWMDWFGAEVGFSLYIHRRGFTSTATNSNQPSQQPPKARWRGARAARSARAPNAYARLASSHQHPGQPHHTGVIHPLVAGSIPATRGVAACAGRSGLLSTVARAVASRHGASDNARRPKPKPTRKPGPGSRHSATPSKWRSRRHSGATAGARGSAGQLPGEAGLGSEPSHAIPYPPREDGGPGAIAPPAGNRLGKPGLVVDSKEVVTNSPLLASSMEASTGVFRGLRLLGPQRGRPMRTPYRGGEERDRCR